MEGNSFERYAEIYNSYFIAEKLKEKEKTKMKKTAYYTVSICYDGQSIDFCIQLPSDTNIENFKKELREELYIEIEKEGEE